MSETRLQKWLSSYQPFSDQFETEIHEEDINCLGVSSDIHEESFKSLCIQCKKNHIKSTISQMYADMTKETYKLGLHILLHYRSVKSGNKAYLRMRKGPLSKVLFMIKYIKEKEVFEIIFQFIQLKYSTFIDRISEVFMQYKCADKVCQVLLMNETFVLISRVSKLLQPVANHLGKNLKKEYQELFFNKVMNDRSDIYKYLSLVPTPDQADKKLLKKFKKFKISEFEEFENFSVHTHCCSQCDSEFLLEEFQISFQDLEKTDFLGIEKKIVRDSLTIDQIVEFIEGKGSNKEKKNKRRKRKMQVGSKELDNEIESFSMRLESSPASVRLKPCCTSAFIEELKAKIKLIKENRY